MNEHAVIMTFEGRSPMEITCREDEDIVTAAARQGILVLFDCRRGTCGTCRAYADDGDGGIVLDHSPHALSEQDRDAGWILACRYRPRADVRIDFDYPADRVGKLGDEERAAHVVAVERCGASVERVIVRTLAAQTALRWKPGYVRLVTVGVSRAYSIANLPNERRELEFFVRRLPGGRFSEALASMPGPGAAVRLRGPFGAFRGHDDDRLPLFVAGGTGLAPILAMLRDLGARSYPGPVGLVFGVRREEDLFATLELDELAATLPGLRSWVVVEEPGETWNGERGTAVDALRRRLDVLPSARDLSVYVCGPQAMVDAALRLLECAGVFARDVYVEGFRPTGDDS
jgi:methane monooxygenase component C